MQLPTCSAAHGHSHSPKAAGKILRSSVKVGPIEHCYEEVSSPSINLRHDFDHQDLWTDLPGSKDIKKIEVSVSMCISGGYMEPSSQVHCRQSVAGQHQLMAVNCTNDSDWTIAMAMLIENYASQTRRQAACKLYACNSFQGRPQTLQRRWHHMKAPLCWVVDRHRRTALCFPKSIGSNQPCAQS